MREATFDRTVTMERLQADFRKEKTAALVELRESLERKHAQEIGSLVCVCVCTVERKNEVVTSLAKNNNYYTSTATCMN